MFASFFLFTFLSLKFPAYLYLREQLFLEGENTTAAIGQVIGIGDSLDGQDPDFQYTRHKVNSSRFVTFPEILMLIGYV
ncbi:hypothetical protein C5167_027146 [Papaver somniferum]|nr:hypothetical protein C5167_027146 [Papaver somniferum]